LLSSLRRSTSHSEFIPVIDGLRFLAILPVVLHHLAERVLRIAESEHLTTISDYALMNLFSTARLGVELFFGISGLIISYPFIRARFQDQQTPSVRNFYLRRLTRLEPPYLLVMIGCYLFLRFTHFNPEATNSFAAQSINLETSLAASLVYMHGVLFGGLPKLNPPAWSLEIEFQFYILVPIVLLAILRLRLYGIIVGILTLIAGSIFASHLIVGPWHEVSLIDFFHLFLAGIFVNVLILSNLVPQRVPSVVWDVGFIVATAVLYASSQYQTSILTDTAQVVCYLILFLAAFKGKFFKRLLSHPYIFTIGGMCYTLYLIHLPIFQILTGIVMRTSGFTSFVPGVLINAVVTLPFLLAASVAFFLLIEKPCMNSKWPLLVVNSITSWVVHMKSVIASRHGRKGTSGCNPV
jgi:peptidoglycan/LPS O-acetylase OafA/YrhL